MSLKKSVMKILVLSLFIANFVLLSFNLNSAFGYCRNGKWCYPVYCEMWADSECFYMCYMYQSECRHAQLVNNRGTCDSGCYCWSQWRIECENGQYWYDWCDEWDIFCDETQ